MYLLGFMPECFKLIKIIFIPKLDKPAYDVPKAHRPISLMNNIIKIPEKLFKSPFLWSAVLNELIKILKELEEIKVVAYADDLCLVATGPDKDHCIQVLQQSVDVVMTWAGRHLLALSPTKSESIVFTKKRNYPRIVDSAAQIKINGCPIEYERGLVRYLAGPKSKQG